MKIEINVGYVIHRNGEPNTILAHLECVGVISAPALPRKGEQVLLKRTLVDGGEWSALEVVSVEHRVNNGVVTPEISIEEFCYEVQEHMDGGVSEADGVRNEIDWVKKYFIPALKKQGFTSFTWRKVLITPSRE